MKSVTKAIPNKCLPSTEIKSRCDRKPLSDPESDSDSDTDFDNDEESEEMTESDNITMETESLTSRSDNQKCDKNAKKCLKCHLPKTDNNTNDSSTESESDAQNKKKSIKLERLSANIKKRFRHSLDKSSSNKKPRYESDDVSEDEDDAVVSVDKGRRRHKSKRDTYEDNFIEETKEDVNKRAKKDFIIISSDSLNDDDYTDEDEEIDKILNGEDDECGSDDEEIFMKSVYVKELKEIDNTDVCPPELKAISKNKKSSIANIVDVDMTVIHPNVEGEYTTLITMKKYIMEQLKAKPDGKFLKKSLDDCNNEIKDLIMSSRSKNTRDYHELISSKNKKMCEIGYFKKNLSNTEQLSIVNEMQRINEHLLVGKPHRLTLLSNDMPIKYKATVMQKLNILDSMEHGDPEFYKIKNWVDTFMRVPFMKYTALPINISDGIDKCNTFMEGARKTLDDCVYGMDSTKLQILQMMGQWIANPAATGSAIGISGKMGTGKTSIIKDGVSKILGREFAFISLGGASDSSFLDGHSYTYEGSSWGKIIQILIDTRCMNPIIYFDELDKVSDSPRGEEIINMLIHLIDSTQNNQFHDKYFSEIDFDLSKCIFFFSYNDASKVNPILRDRMYRIEVNGYEHHEKIVIAQKYLIPKIREQVNFKEGDIIIPDDTLRYIITTHRYTQNEVGVRNLKRCLEMLYTNLNLYRLVVPGSILFGGSKMNVSFPFTVTQEAVGLLIRSDDTQNQSLLSMYV
jgi:hypothetical protein